MQQHRHQEVHPGVHRDLALEDLRHLAESHHRDWNLEVCFSGRAWGE
jgi:hypothetical protein